MAEQKHDVPENPGESDVVRICVLGASGVGKSSLCNFLSNSQRFQVGGGFDSCTQHSCSHAFTAQANGQSIALEITDTPGWFHCDGDPANPSERLPSVEHMVRKMKECMRISETGIAAFMVVVPFERISIDTEQAIYFMRDCFSSSQLCHIWMVFTKCAAPLSTVMRALQEQQQRGRTASGIVYHYAQQLDGGKQCFTVDLGVDADDEKAQQGLAQRRAAMLDAVHARYVAKGVIPDGVFERVRREHRSELMLLSHRHRDEQAEQHARERKLKQMASVGALVGVGAVAVGINGYLKYAALVDRNASLSQHTAQLEHETSALAQQTQELAQKTQQLESINEQNNRLWGLSEVAAGALGFAIEPISATMAIVDGLWRLYSPGAKADN